MAGVDPSQLIYQTRRLVTGRKLYTEGTGCKCSREESSVCPVVDQHKVCLSKKNSRPVLKISINEDNHLLIGIVPSTGIQKEISHKILDTRLFTQESVVEIYLGANLYSYTFLWEQASKIPFERGQPFSPEKPSDGLVFKMLCPPYPIRFSHSVQI